MNIYKKLNIKKPTEKQLGFFANTISIIAIVGITLNMWRDRWQTEIEVALIYFGIIAFCLVIGYCGRCGIEVYRALMVVPRCIGKLLTTISHKRIINTQNRR